MRRCLVLLMLMVFTTFMVACSSGGEIDYLNDKIDKMSEEIKTLKIENEKLKDQLKDSNNKPAPMPTPIESKITFYLNQVYYNGDADVEILKKDAEGRGKQPIIEVENEGNVILMMVPSDEIKDVRLHKLGEEFINLDFKIDDYLNKYRDVDYTELVNLLTKTQALIVKVNESEGIPTDCISWKDGSGKVGYYLIEYDGKGNY